MLGKRRRPAKKNSRVRKLKTTVEESSSPPASITTAPIVDDDSRDVPASQELSHEDRFPKDIKSKDGRVERIEYFCSYTSPFQEGDIPTHPPDFNTVQTERSGKFWHRESGGDDTWIFMWRIVPGYYPEPGEEEPSSPKDDGISYPDVGQNYFGDIFGLLNKMLVDKNYEVPDTSAAQAVQ